VIAFRERKRLIACIGVGVGLVGPTAARADVQFNGFGQVVVGSALGNNQSFPTRTTLYAYSADPSFENESLFGLQAQAPLSDSLSATAQIVASGAPNDLTPPNALYNCGAMGTSQCALSHEDFTPKFTWAYVNWTINDNLSLKAGRQRLPLYHYSDYLQVGEAYPWIRPPVSVYSSPVSNYDGVSLQGQFSAGNWFVQPQIYYGAFDGTIFTSAASFGFKLQNLTGAVFEANYADWFDFRVSYAFAWMGIHGPTVDQLTQEQAQVADAMTSQLSLAALGVDGILSNPGIQGALGAAGYTPQQIAGWMAGMQGFNTAGAAYGAIAQDSVIDHQFISYSSAGIEINKYNFVFDGEYIYQKSPGWVNSLASYYVSLGYHIGHFTPVLTYGRTDSRPGDKATDARLRSNANQAYLADTTSTAAYGAACAAIKTATTQTCSQFNAQLPNSMDNLTPAGTVVNPLTGQTGAALLYMENQILANYSNAIDDYYEFGIRYDVSRNAALKLDYTYYASPLSQTGPTGFYPYQGASHAQLLSAAFVFTF
jgi:hypothetical protein